MTSPALASTILSALLTTLPPQQHPAAPTITPEVPSCTLEPVTTIPLRETGYTMSIPAFLNGRALSLVVDTGSEGSLLTPQSLAALALTVDNTHNMSIISADGQKHSVPTILVNTLQLGSLRLTQFLFPLGKLPGIPMINPPVSGLLGMDILGQYDLEIDLPHQRLTLWRVHLGSLLCQPPPHWIKPWKRLASYSLNGRFLVSFNLDGHSGMALVDTGAHSHILSTTFAYKTGLRHDQLARDPGGMSASVSADSHTKEKPYHWHRFTILRIGTEVESSPILTVAPLHEQADMLLGADWFTARKVWLSNAARTIFVQDATLAAQTKKGP